MPYVQLMANVLSTLDVSSVAEVPAVNVEHAIGVGRDGLHGQAVAFRCIVGGRRPAHCE